MSIHYVPARRPPTPDIMADVLGPMQDDVTQIRTQLRYDYSLIPAEQRESVQAAAVDIVRAGRRAQDDLMRIGQRLLGVKETLEHGQFEDWCATEFQMSVRTARNMMNVARTFTDKTETVSVLSDSVMYLLAAPSTPEAARVEVIEQARAAGKSPTKIEVQETIRKYQPAYATVAQLEEIVRETAARWYREETPAYAVSDMRAAARVRGGGFWMNCIGKTDPPQWREVDLAMAIRFVADEMERPQPETPGAVFNQNGPSRPAPQPAPQRPAAWDGVTAHTWEGYTDWTAADDAEYAVLAPIWQQPAATLPINADKDITRWRVAARLASERQDNIAFTLQETARRLMRAERYAADDAWRADIASRQDAAEEAERQPEPAPVQHTAPAAAVDLDDLEVAGFVTLPVGGVQLDADDEEEATLAAKRMNRLHTLKVRFGETIDMLDEFGDLTGRHTASLMAKRELTNLVEILNSEMDALEKGVRGV